MLAHSPQASKCEQLSIVYMIFFSVFLWYLERFAVFFVLLFYIQLYLKDSHP